jgi:hypothetical protein
MEDSKAEENGGSHSISALRSVFSYYSVFSFRSIFKYPSKPMRPPHLKFQKLTRVARCLEWGRVSDRFQ